MESNLLQTFWSLSSLEEEERIEAAKCLFKLLKQHQTASESDGPCHELEYAVKRLVKGLASNRKGARHGFYIILTEILSQFPQLSVSKILQLYRTHLEPGKGYTAAEERGLCFGRVFALLALIQSGLLHKTEELVGVASRLVALRKKKVYLQEFCTSVLCQLLERCSADVCRDIMPVLELDGGWDDSTPETLQILLSLSNLCCKEVWFQSFLQTHWNNKDICNHVNFDLMTPALIESSLSAPRLHGLWELILDAVRSRGHFGKFWKTVIDDGLLCSGRVRKSVAFQLLEKLLPSLSADEVGVVFSPNLLRCLFNNSHSANNYLYSTARHLITELTSFVETTDNQQLLASLLVHLQRKANGKFDQLTGSKVMELLTSRVDVNGVCQLLELLQAMLAGCYHTDGHRDEEHEVQLWALDQVLSIVRNPHLPRRAPWLISAATLLLGHTFFSFNAHGKEKLPQPLSPMTSSLEPSVRECCRLRFFSVLSDLSSMVLFRSPQGDVAPADNGDAGQSRKRQSHFPPGVMESGEYFVTVVFQVAQQLMNLSRSGDVILLCPFPDEGPLAWETACRTVEVLSNKTDPKNEDKAFLLLFSVAGLEILSPLERARHSRIIMELEVCHCEMEREKRKTKKKCDHKWMEVLTDLLLDLLSRPSQLWRTTVQQAFRLMSGFVTSESLQLILNLLKPKQSVEDVMEGGEKEEDEEDSEDKESAASSSGGEDEMEEVDSAFAEQVHRALGAAAAVGSDGESEESLDDDAMMEVDKALGEVFRTRFALKHQKKQQRDDEESLLHFKLRVLDLIDIFLRRESTNPLIFNFILPLYEVVRASHGKKTHVPLTEKAAGIFLNRICHSKEYPKTGLDTSAIHDLLHQLLQYLYKGSSPVTSPLLTSGCMFLIRVLRGVTAQPATSPLTTRAGRKRKKKEIENEVSGAIGDNGQLNVAMVTEWFSDALQHFMTVKNSSVPLHFFTTYVQRYPGLAALLLPRIVQNLPAAANHFKKTQVLQIVAVLVSRGENEELLGELTPEDAESLHNILTRTGRKRGPKRKKFKNSISHENKV